LGPSSSLPTSLAPAAAPFAGNSRPPSLVAGRCSRHTHHPEARTQHASAANTVTVAGRSTATAAVKNYTPIEDTASGACNMRSTSSARRRHRTDRIGSTRLRDVSRRNGRMCRAPCVPKPRGTGWMHRGGHVPKRQGTEWGHRGKGLTAGQEIQYVRHRWQRTAGAVTEPAQAEA